MGNIKLTKKLEGDNWKQELDEKNEKTLKDEKTLKEKKNIEKRKKK